MEEITITPNAAKTIESLRHLTYTNVSALADIVDNSLDADASNVWLNLGSKSEEAEITILDDGYGMNRDVLKEAVKLGSDTPKEGTDLGRFGMGLVTASISMARRLEVVSKTASGEINKVVLDLDKIVALNDWKAEFTEPTSTERILFRDLECGTLVALKKLDKLQYKTTNYLATRVGDEFSEIFRKYLSANVVIKINGIKLIPSDPLELDKKTEVLFDDNIEFKGSALSVKLVMLEHTGTDTARERGYNIPNQGVYVVRNNRQIAHGIDLGLFTKHNDFNRLRIEVSYDGSLDEWFGINFTKNEIVANQALTETLKTQLGALVVMVRNRAKANQAVDKSKQIDHKESEEVIARKARLLKTKDVLKEKRGPRLEHGGGESKDPATTKKREHIRNFQRGGKSIIVKFGEIDLGTTGDLYQIDFEGTITVINWNISHPFHREMVAKYSGDKDISLPLDFLVFSLATAELNMQNDANRSLMEQIRGDLSANLRVLMQ
jgi:hypothetical protein